MWLTLLQTLDYQTQVMSVLSQLESGIRALDLSLFPVVASDGTVREVKIVEGTDASGSTALRTDPLMVVMDDETPVPTAAVTLRDVLEVRCGPYNMQVW